MSLFHCNFFAHTLGMPTNVTVFIPAVKPEPNMNFNDIYPKNQKYRTLYLLHGMNGDETTWLRKTNVERYAQEHNLAFVMPSVHNSFYTDTTVGLAFFTYLTKELPAMLSMNFPLSQSREDTYIAGLSMGGYGAAKAALTHPELYGAFGSFSGALDIEAVANMASEGGAMPLFKSVFGDPKNISGSSADLFSLSENLIKNGKKIPRAYLACGTLDTLCYDMNIRFKNHLDKLSFKFDYNEEEAAHEWDFWDKQIKLFLDWL